MLDDGLQYVCIDDNIIKHISYDASGVFIILCVTCI